MSVKRVGAQDILGTSMARSASTYTLAGAGLLPADAHAPPGALRKYYYDKHGTAPRCVHWVERCSSILSQRAREEKTRRRQAARAREDEFVQRPASARSGKWPGRPAGSVCQQQGSRPGAASERARARKVAARQTTAEHGSRVPPSAHRRRDGIGDPGPAVLCMAAQSPSLKPRQFSTPPSPHLCTHPSLSIHPVQ